MTAPSKYEGMIFVAAPREMSMARFKQIVKHYLPKGPILLGISKEPYVIGFENQPQFRMLEQSVVQPIIEKVNANSSDRSIEIIVYSQVDLPTIVATHDFKRVLLVNGSWKFTFQNHPAYKILNERGIPFKYISPFIDETEAQVYEENHSYKAILPAIGTKLSDEEMLTAAAESAKQSYDYSFQTGMTFGKKVGNKYEYLGEAFNKVVPYQTYALHHGNEREKHATGVHDISHYDTVHAEMFFLTRALQRKTDISGTSLFINLLPCSTCARTLSQTDIAEIVYVNDHSGGYAVTMLEASGKIIRRAKTAK